MSTTMTVRADEALKKALQQRAEAEGKSTSEVIREILESALTQRPMAERTGHLRGRLEQPAQPTDPWRAQLRDRNWRS